MIIIGTDEVGTGDVFGPVVVCACAVKEESIDYLNTLGITDSKKITDTKIVKLSKLIKDHCHIQILVLNNTKYNELVKRKNLNEIKALLHNLAIYNMTVKDGIKYDKIIIDGFCTQELYFKYLKNEKNFVKDVNLIPKAESQYLSVACASVIARNVFLDEMIKLSNYVKLNLQKGASKLVDAQIQEILSLYDKEKLLSISKANFKNIKNVL